MTADAAPAAIVAVWADVAQWPSWDRGLRSAELEGALRQGAIGRLVSDQGQRARFEIVAYDSAVGYVMRSPVPLGALEITRVIVRSEAGQTVLMHRVRLRGMARIVLRGAAKRWMVLLPSVVESVARRAGASQVTTLNASDSNTQ